MSSNLYRTKFNGLQKMSVFNIKWKFQRLWLFSWRTQFRLLLPFIVGTSAYHFKMLSSISSGILKLENILLLWLLFAIAVAFVSRFNVPSRNNISYAILKYIFSMCTLGVISKRTNFEEFNLFFVRFSFSVKLLDIFNILLFKILGGLFKNHLFDACFCLLLVPFNSTFISFLTVYTWPSFSSYYRQKCIPCYNISSIVFNYCNVEVIYNYLKFGKNMYILGHFFD